MAIVSGSILTPGGNAVRVVDEAADNLAREIYEFIYEVPKHRLVLVFYKKETRPTTGSQWNLINRYRRNDPQQSEPMTFTVELVSLPNPIKNAAINAFNDNMYATK